MKIEVYDFVSQKKFIGELDFQLSKVLSSKKQTLTLYLSNGNQIDAGKVKIKAS